MFERQKTQCNDQIFHRLSWFISVVYQTQPGFTWEEKNSMNKSSRSVGPLPTSVRDCCLMVAVGGGPRVPPTVESLIPRQVGLLCTKKLTEQIRDQTRKQHCSMVSASGSCLDFPNHDLEVYDDITFPPRTCYWSEYFMTTTENHLSRTPSLSCQSPTCR